MNRLREAGGFLVLGPTFFSKLEGGFKLENET